MAVVGVCGVVAVAGGCVFALSGQSSALPNQGMKAAAEVPMTLEYPLKEGVRKTGIRAGEVCTTPECVIAGKKRSWANYVILCESLTLSSAGHVLETMDQTADPCEDFFQFACGGWIQSNTIPESSSKWGKFYELRDKVDQRNRGNVHWPSSYLISRFSTNDHNFRGSRG